MLKSPIIQQKYGIVISLAEETEKNNYDDLQSDIETVHGFGVQTLLDKNDNQSSNDESIVKY